MADSLQSAKSCSAVQKRAIAVFEARSIGEGDEGEGCVFRIAYMTLRPCCMAERAEAAIGSHRVGCMGGVVFGGWRSQQCWMSREGMAVLISCTTACATGHCQKACFFHESQWAMVDWGSTFVTKGGSQPHKHDWVLTVSWPPAPITPLLMRRQNASL